MFFEINFPSVCGFVTASVIVSVTGCVVFVSTVGCVVVSSGWLFPGIADALDASSTNFSHVPTEVPQACNIPDVVSFISA